MRSLWLLPDRGQEGMSYTVEGLSTKPIDELVDLKTLPPELTLGIPEELSRAHQDSPFIYGQFAKIAEGQSLFCISTAAGKDISGRQVFLTNLQILSMGEKPVIPPPSPQNIGEAECVWLEKLLSTDHNSFEPIHRMLEAVASNQYARSFASEVLFSTKYKPDWMPKKKELAFSKKHLAALIALITFSLAIYEFYN